MSASAFQAFGAPVTWLELVAFVLSIWMVVCNIRVNATGWPLAIVSSLLYFMVFWQSRLYGDASLQLVFVVVAAWGWRQWLRAPDGPEAPLEVRAMSGGQRLSVLVALTVMWPLIGLFLARYTDTDVPWFDAFPTSASLVGQWLLGRKYVENWPMWVAVNAVSVGLFAYKGLWLTALLYAIFLAMSFMGWRAWQRLSVTSSLPRRAPALAS
jgi:nicotinamide mononucleotide transporter